jgi:hypothetical protein
MIREVGRGEGVALDYPGGREVVVYLDRIVSASRAVFRYVSRTVGEETEEVTWTLAEDECIEPGGDVRVCLHDVRSGAKARLRIHAPREVSIDFADARYDEVER